MAFMAIYRWHVGSLNNIYGCCHSAGYPLLVSLQTPKMGAVAGCTLWMRGRGGIDCRASEVTGKARNRTATFCKKLKHNQWKATKSVDGATETWWKRQWRTFECFLELLLPAGGFMNQWKCLSLLKLKLERKCATPPPCNSERQPALLQLSACRRNVGKETG